MTLHQLVLYPHVALGCAGLIVGLIAMRARKLPGTHTNAGEVYHWLLLLLCVTACGLAALRWDDLWWYVPIAMFTYGLALLGYLAAKKRWNNWLDSHLSGQLGSYTAMVTAVMVVNLGSHWWAWAGPTIIASPLIAWLKREVAAGRRPKY